MAQIRQAMGHLDEVARRHVAAIRQVEQAARDLNVLSTRMAGLTASGIEQPR